MGPPFPYHSWVSHTIPKETPTTWENYRNEGRIIAGPSKFHGLNPKCGLNMGRGGYRFEMVPTSEFTVATVCCGLKRGVWQLGNSSEKMVNIVEPCFSSFFHACWHPQLVSHVHRCSFERIVVFQWIQQYDWCFSAKSELNCKWNCSSRHHSKFTVPICFVCGWWTISFQGIKTWRSSGRWILSKRLKHK